MSGCRQDLLQLLMERGAPAGKRHHGGRSRRGQHGLPPHREDHPRPVESPPAHGRMVQPASAALIARLRVPDERRTNPATRHLNAKRSTVHERERGNYTYCSGPLQLSPQSLTFPTFCLHIHTVPGGNVPRPSKVNAFTLLGTEVVRNSLPGRNLERMNLAVSRLSPPLLRRRHLAPG